MSNRRFLEVSIKTGIQNRNGAVEYDHQDTTMRQTYPDTPLGFKAETDIQEAIVMPIANIVNEALVDQKNKILDEIGLDGPGLQGIEIKGEDL